MVCRHKPCLEPINYSSNWLQIWLRTEVLTGPYFSSLIHPCIFFHAVPSAKYPCVPNSYSLLILKTHQSDLDSYLHMRTTVLSNGEAGNPEEM